MQSISFSELNQRNTAFFKAKDILPGFLILEYIPY